jgi:hypothetical protein
LAKQPAPRRLLRIRQDHRIPACIIILAVC